MVAEQTCMGPILCRTRTGECCQLVLDSDRAQCPASCNINRQSQQQSGYTLRQVFDVTLVTTFMYNVLTHGAYTTTTTTTSTTTTTTSTTTTTTTATPMITSSKGCLYCMYIGHRRSHAKFKGDVLKLTNI